MTYEIWLGALVTSLIALVMFTMAASGSEPHTVVKHDRVDVIELNHKYDADGERQFSQWIFWNWYLDMHDVVAWRMSQDSRYCVTSGKKLIMLDGGAIRVIRGGQRRESWTQYDPEIKMRQVTPQDHREGLSQ